MKTSFAFITAAVVAVVRRELETLQLRAAPSPPAIEHFCVTDAGDNFRRLADRFLGRHVTLEWVDVT